MREPASHTHGGGEQQQNIAHFHISSFQERAAAGFSGGGP
jgi:hypothetical protein